MELLWPKKYQHTTLYLWFPIPSISQSPGNFSFFFLHETLCSYLCCSSSVISSSIYFQSMLGGIFIWTWTEIFILYSSKGLAYCELTMQSFFQMAWMICISLSYSSYSMKVWVKLLYWPIQVQLCLCEPLA